MVKIKVTKPSSMLHILVTMIANVIKKLKSPETIANLPGCGHKMKVDHRLNRSNQRKF